MIELVEDEYRPKTQLEPQMGGSGKPPRPTCVGLSDGKGDDHNLIRGQVVRCYVIERSTAGYKVELVGMSISGQLNTDSYYAIGSTIQAAFVNWSKVGTAILEAVDYPHRLESQVMSGQPSSFLQDGSQTSFQDIFGRSTIDRSEHQQSMTHRYNRAVDLFVPPLNESESQKIAGGHGAVLELIPRLKLIQYTGCLLGTADTFFSRGGLLLYKGSCIGGVYSNNFEKGITDTLSSMRHLVNDLLDKESKIQCYTLPEGLALAYSALFVGSRLESDDQSSGWKYLQGMIAGYGKARSTGTISVSLSYGVELCFVFMHEGHFEGMFMVQDRLFADRLEDVEEILGREKLTRIDAHVIPGSGKPLEYDLEEHLPRY